MAFRRFVSLDHAQFVTNAKAIAALAAKRSLAERPRSYARIGAALRGAFTGAPPAQTFLIVAGLAFPQLKVEIEAIAAVKTG